MLTQARPLGAMCRTEDAVKHPLVLLDLLESWLLDTPVADRPSRESVYLRIAEINSLVARQENPSPAPPAAGEGVA